jgi:hypothetical protein
MPVPCTNHPTVEATRTCAGCRRPYCDNCVVELGGWTYCGPCKNSAVAASQSVYEFSLPKQALTISIVGFFCCGIILGPIGIYKGIDALNQIKANPQLPGHGMAIAAIVVGAISLLANLAGVVMQFTGVLTGLS